MILTQLKIHPTPSTVTLEGTVYLDRHATLFQGLQNSSRFVCNHCAGCAARRQERIAVDLCENCG